MKHLQKSQPVKLISNQNCLAKSTRWLLTLFVCMLVINAAATIRRVDGASGNNGNSGSSWGSALKTLDHAINLSNSGDEIWIKRGHYKPSPTFDPFNPHNSSYHMKNGVKIYGGFAGTENAPNQRDMAQIHELNRVSLGPNADYGAIVPVIDNFDVNNTALLDGISIGNGYSNATGGGGMRNTGGSFPTINNVVFNSNHSGNNGGGALYIDGGNSPVTNVFFYNNYTTGSGGAIYMKNCTSTFTNVLFKNNYGTGGSGSLGGALYSEESAPVLVNVVFEANYTAGNGGAMYCTNPSTIASHKPNLTNVVFYNNRSTNGLGGGICNSQSSATLVNCTFAQNRCGVSEGGGGLYTTSPAFGGNPTVKITNCVFKANNYVASGGATTLNDVGVQGGTNNITYSSFKEQPNVMGTGNIDAVPTPFVNISNGAGSDGDWMTADDGLRLALCTATGLIDKGDNTATSITTDIRGLARKVDVGLVPDGGAGTGAKIDMGAYEDQTTTTLLSITGSIGNPHTVPFPQEMSPDNITNVQSPASGTTISWQSSPDSANWATIPGATAATYSIPSISQTTYYRRGATSASLCSSPFYSNVVKIKVVQPNGSIKGKVISKNGTGVQGITVNAKRLTPVSGSPADYTYTTTTTSDGTYTISPIYYGDPSLGNVSATFRVTPVKPNHGFNLPYLDRILTTNNPQESEVNFTDTTVLSITGRTYQQCNGCIEVNQICPIDSVTIFKDNLYTTISGFIDTAYGRYAVTVSDPVQVKIEPRLTGHTFSPAFRNIIPNNNVPNVDFQDITTHTITGKLTAGCNGYIGTAVLEFSDVLPKAADGTARNSCFRKRVTTNAGSGFYSITLPARKYSVRLISFSPLATNDPAYVSGTSVLDFVNTKISIDSLTRDISTRDTTLNIVYQRPPVVSITGLNTICNQPYTLIKQAETDSFKVFVYQGPASFGCPLSDTNKIKIITNVHNEDQTQEFRYALADTGIRVKIKGGTPNITGDHLKDIFIYFTDKYGRVAPDFNRRVLVTGVKADAATFTTVSPQIPLMVLHDPPGDASYSTWQQNHSVENTMRFYTATGVGTEGWIQAKIGAKAQIGLAVSTEISAWGTIGATIGVASTSTSADEAVITTTTTQDFSTADNSDIIGSQGDVYIGAALNLIYAVSTEIGFRNCAVSNNRKLIIANNGFNTQYIYSEDHILNTLIPNLQRLAQLSPDSSAKYLDQVRVWQQVVDNNTENKRIAAFAQNYSFDGAAGPYTNSVTSSSSNTNTVEFSLEVNTAVALELGFEVSGSGISGGVNVNFKSETGESESTTVTDESTIAYTLDDDDAGDFFSVNVKKDPVYNTPVFELAAGTASCPAEPGAQPRDEMYVTAVNPVVQNVPGSDYANFTIKIYNTSQSNETRTYRLAYDQGSNIANESVRIAGTDYTGIPITLSPLAYLDSAIVIVSIRRLPGSSVYSYEGERFVITDNCDGSVSKTVQVSAYYVSPCSSITLSQPADGWLITSTTGNSVFVRASGFTANYSSIELEYSSGTGNIWSTIGGTPSASQLTNGYNVDVSGLKDGAYNFRFRLSCTGGTVFSQRVTGFIDRKAPQLFARPDPTDDRYVAGDVIAFTYTEKLNNIPDSLQVTVRRLSNGAILPATVSISDNKIVVTPNSSIAGLTGDSIRVVVGRVSDEYGNRKLTADTLRFVVGTTVVGTGNQALTVSITNPAVYKNGDSTINVFFNLPVNATRETRVNYAIGGTARYGIDYTVIYTGADALYAGFNGSTGAIKIANNTKQAILRIKPVGGDTGWTADKTVIISLSEGGDYSIGATNSVTGKISSEDGISVYTFTGDGAWNIKNNWLNGKMPLTTLMAPKEIIVNPTGIARLNVKQTIKPGAKLTVKQNRQLVIQGSLKQQ